MTAYRQTVKRLFIVFRMRKNHKEQHIQNNFNGNYNNTVGLAERINHHSGQYDVFEHMQKEDRKRFPFGNDIN